MNSMFAYEEYITLLSSLALLAVSILWYSRSKTTISLAWIIASISFLIISLGLAIWGLEVLGHPLVPVVGMLYPGFLAVGILAVRYKLYLYWAILVIVFTLLLAIGKVTGLKPLAGVSLGLVHTISGLVIVLIPLYYVYSRVLPSYAILVSTGGLLISIGGLGLALVAMGRPLIPLETIVYILHPVLFTSAFLMAAGFHLTRGLRG